MTYKVNYASPYNFSIKISQPVNYKTNFSTTLEVMPTSLNQLTDVEISGNNDQYVLMYDASSGKWRDVNPDVVLNAAAQTETVQPGLVGFASAFLDRVDIDLDDRIDLDAGTF